MATIFSTSQLIRNFLMSRVKTYARVSSDPSIRRSLGDPRSPTMGPGSGTDVIMHAVSDLIWNLLSTGNFGATGVQGITGPRGATGVQGSGATGVQGNTGVRGATGVQGNTGVQGATGSFATAGTPGGAFLQFTYWNELSNIAVNTSMYQGPLVADAVPNESTRTNTGMRNGNDLCPIVVPVSGTIKQAVLMLASASNIVSTAPTYPCVAALGIFRLNYATDLPLAGNLARTLLSILTFSIPTPGTGRKVGTNADLLTALMAGDGGTDGRYQRTDLSISVSYGWYLGVELLYPSNNGAGLAQSTIDGTNYLWTAPGGGSVSMNNAIGGYKNTVLSLQIL